MAEKNEGCATGIDLGTTYSCVAVWQEQHNRVEIIHNDQGNRMTPSFVAFTNEQRLISDAAKNQAATNPENTVFDAKRLIGRKYSDTILQKDISLWPFKVIDGVNDKPMIVVKYKDRCLGDAKIDESDVHDIVLVGGSSRIPKLQELLEEFFKGKNLCVKNIPDLVLFDVTPLSLGILTKGDLMSVEIPRNTTIPVKKESVYITTQDDQLSARIDVYEVSAEDKSTGKENEITITNEGRLSSEEIKRMIEEAVIYTDEDKKYKKKVNAINALDYYLYKVKNHMKQKMRAAITEAENLLDENQEAETDVLENSLDKLKSIFEPILVKRKREWDYEHIILDD
ncbi:Heat shock protein 70 family [Sesbania bispinosa]|nr:Heat shock protein 70 family [Sesbania bispinosa]